MSLEQIIRPFQADSPFARVAGLTVVGSYSGVQNVTVKFGDDAVEPKTLTGSSSVSNTIHQDQEATITPHKTEVARVENEDDPDQYVDTERYTELDQESGKGKRYRRVRAKVDNSDTESADQKILRKNRHNNWNNFSPGSAKDEFGQSLLNDDGTVRAWSWEGDGAREYDNGNGTWSRVGG